MTQDQLARWCASVLELIAGGHHNVDDIIKARKGARMSTLVALKHLQQIGSVARYGNTVTKL